MQTTIRNILFCALLAISTGIPHLQAADVKISGLPAGSALAGTEQIPAVQGGATVKTTPAAIKTYVETGGTVTASDPVLDLTQTWNSGAVTFEGLKLNVTDTASAAASELLDLQVGGTSKVSILKSGQLNLGYTAVGAGVGQLQFIPATGTGVIFSIASNGSSVNVASSSTGTGAMVLRSSGVDLAANGRVSFTNASNNPSTTIDLYLERDASGVLSLKNSTNPQGLRVYDTYTDASNYGRLALNTSLTGDWVQVAAETAGTAGDNYGIALTPTGTGAISAQVPDSATASGNARGNYAVDWQMTRGAATQVASGAESVIGGGTFNTASGIRSTVSGGQTNNASSTTATVGGGTANTASGMSSTISGGSTNIASGQFSWVPGGIYANTRGLVGAGAYASDRRAASGDAQVILQPVRRTTTDATPVSLATDGTPAATTVMVLPASSMMACEALVGMKYGADSAGYKLLAVFERDGSNNTSLVGSVTQTVIAEDAGLSGADATFVANDTLESAQVQVTGPAGTAYSVAEVKCVQVL